MEIQTMKISYLAAVLPLLAGCTAPTVNLATGEPIKVDIAMRLDVYNHNKTSGQPVANVVGNTNPDTEARRRNRMADIQSFKNSRFVGEGRDGLLAIRSEPAGEEGDYLRKTVASENADRMVLMKAAAEKAQKPLPTVQAEQSELWQKRSFSGEWIEVKTPDDTFQWVEKSGG